MDQDKGEMERHVILVGPEVHWNTGNIGRTCLGAGACLHLVKPIGFSLGSREVKRAGLDYWPKVRLKIWDDFESLISAMKPNEDEVALFAKLGEKSVWDMPKKKRMFLVFGSETKGLLPDVLERFNRDIYHIPMTREIRCLNLSTAVGIALYESLRGYGPCRLCPPENPACG